MNRTEMRRCGKPYLTERAALATRKGRTGAYEARFCRCSAWHLRRKRSAARAEQRTRRETGFPRPVKLLIRTRAGNGDPAKACCEACAVFLGEHGGQIQHIYARGKGGTRDPLYNSAAAGALLCGTSYTGDHGLCESRDPHMREMGFWRERNGLEKPGDYPIMLHGEFGGARLWLTEDGGYSEYPPVARGERQCAGLGACSCAAVARRNGTRRGARYSPTRSGATGHPSSATTHGLTGGEDERT